MPNALIYSPIFDGHRQMYVYVLTHLLTDLGFDVFIAGNLKEKLNDSSYLDRIKEDKRAVLIDTSVYRQNGLQISNEEFIELQNQCNADLSVFAEADHHISLFNSQLNNRKKKLKGKTIGIFLRPFHFYKKLTFIDKLRYVKNLPSDWKTDARLFHEYLLKRFKLLNSALYIDENFVSHHPYFYWLPDVFQKYAEEIIGSENREQRCWIDKLNHFREENKEAFIFLYFGTAQNRRGYDLLLKMAVEQNACFIHCGLPDSKEKYDLDVDGLRRELENKKRLFETNQYISDPLCIECFFRSATHLVLPYRNFYGSSGIMLQALGYGIPVLVPENGIMGYRVKKHKLGYTYKDEASLYEQFEKFKRCPLESFKNSISQYMEHQTSHELKMRLSNIFKNSEADTGYQTIP
jgi:hypothetical protein